MKQSHVMTMKNKTQIIQVQLSIFQASTERRNFWCKICKCANHYPTRVMKYTRPTV